jgi:hypothetical protein
MRSMIWTAIAACLALAACEDEESGCKEAGGTVVTEQCCASVSDFPNTCLVGACGCSPEYSAPRKVCECPAGTCFDGTNCASP